MIDLSALTITYKSNDNLMKMFFDYAEKNKKKKRRRKAKPKEIIEPGKYCPKEKPGQAWSYVKDTSKEKEDGEE